MAHEGFEARSGPLLPSEYRCSRCGEIYTLCRTDEDCKAEEMENFGFNAEEHDRAIVCEDCYQDFMRAWNAGELAQGDAE